MLITKKGRLISICTVLILTLVLMWVPLDDTFAVMKEVEKPQTTTTFYSSNTFEDDYCKASVKGKTMTINFRTMIPSCEFRIAVYGVVPKTGYTDLGIYVPAEYKGTSSIGRPIYGFQYTIDFSKLDIDDGQYFLYLSSIENPGDTYETAPNSGGLYKNLAFSLKNVQCVSYGATAADPHHFPDDTKLKDGDAVLLDLFSRKNYYWCDMTRTVFYKSVSAHHREVYEVVKTAQQAAIDFVKPGVVMKDIDAVARKVITDAGYGEYFITRTGHGVGMDLHELPFAAPDSEIIAEPGMCFSIEPGIYIPEDIGVRIEDLVLVTEDGCEVLTHYPKELQIIG